MAIDFLIVGQGLAGSLLAWELIQRDCQIVIVDNGQENASQVAAGLINPVTGLRFAKSSDVDVLLPAAKNYYARLVDFFNQDFYHEKPMLRIFSSEEELKFCQKRLLQAGYENYLGLLTGSERPLDNLETPFGFMEQKQTGYLSTRLLLQCLKNFFMARGCYKHCQFDYRDLQFEPQLRWQNLSARRLIFCEGYQAGGNPWFNRLPWQPVKGEILTLQHKAELPDKILNYGHWLIPLRHQNARIGASFDREHLDTDITVQARDALLKSLKKIAPIVKVDLIDQQAGIRPCTPDRQPFVGTHPRHSQLAIFNGFGAKGSLQIPWYAQHFADVLLKGTPLLKTCDIQRHETNLTG